MSADKDVIANYVDRYGEEREIHQTRHGLKRRNQRTTPALRLNRHVAGLIGPRIRALRKERGISLADLAVACGFVGGHPKSRMWEIENSVRQEGIRLGTLYAIAIALKVEITDLMPPVQDVVELASVEEVPLGRLVVGES